MLQLEGYGQEKASSSLLHLITVSFPSRGSKLTVGQLLVFIFHFEQAGVSFMRPICFFTSSIQSTYSTAYGKGAHSQFLTRFCFIFQGKDVERQCVCVCMCTCLCACMYVCCRDGAREQQHHSLWLSGASPIMPAHHSADELSASP